MADWQAKHDALLSTLLVMRRQLDARDEAIREALRQLADATNNATCRPHVAAFYVIAAERALRDVLK